MCKRANYGVYCIVSNLHLYSKAKKIKFKRSDFFIYTFKFISIHQLLVVELYKIKYHNDIMLFLSNADAELATIKNERPNRSFVRRIWLLLFWSVVRSYEQQTNISNIANITILRRKQIAGCTRHAIRMIA